MAATGREKFTQNLWKNECLQLLHEKKTYVKEWAQVFSSLNKLTRYFVKIFVYTC